MTPIERFVRLLILAYPRRFRDRYGDDMRLLFADRRRAAVRDRRALRFWLATLINIAATAVAERWRSSLDRAVVPSHPADHHDPKGGLVSSLLQDLRYAFRLLSRQPAFSLFVILTLGVGIGANTAVFSVVNGVLLKPLPFPESDRLVAVWGRFDPESGFDFPQFPLSNPEFVDYRTQTHALDDVAAFMSRSITVGGPGAEPERVSGASASANLFPLLRVNALFGRTFTAADDRPNAAATAVLGYGYWQGRFGGDRSVIGRTMPMNGVPTTVIGVMPDGFAFPSTTTRLWLPIRINPASPGNRKGHGIRAIGRLARGATIETARAELRTLMGGWKAQYPDIHTGHYLFIRPLLEDVAGTMRTALLLLLGATGFVLLIVCANVANVVMARGEARIREMAIRGALGAQRARLVRLSLIESGVLGIIGGAVGVGLAHLGVTALVALDPNGIPRASEVGLDGRMLLFAAVLSILSAIVFGLMPALRGASPDLQSTLRESSLSTTGAGSRLLLRRTLVAIEVALAVVLVVGAGLMLRSFDRLFSVDPGFRKDSLLTAGLSLPAADYKDDARVVAFYRDLVSRVSQLPGVTAASAASGVPLWSDVGVWDFEIEGRQRPAAGEIAWNAGVTIATPGFFETLGTRLARGRFFTDRDDERAMPVAIINEALAGRFFSGADPLGHRIRVAGGQPLNQWMTIVGIVGDMRDESLDEAPRPVYFMPHAQGAAIGGAANQMAVLARVSGAPDAAISALRGVVRELDPALPVFDVQTLDAVVDQSLARPRFTTALLTLFAMIGLALGASGIYGVLSFTVSRRTQELGIRRALGASPARLLTDVIKQGMVPVAVGLVIGVAASFWTTTLLRTQLFGVSPTDPATYVMVAAGVVAVSLAACIVPARRALRVSPIVALRAD